MPRVSDAYRDARRRAILDAAVTCFERRGLHGTSTDDIAAEAGLSNGALYRYFDGKAAIIEAIAAERHDQERVLLGAALDHADPRRAVRDFVAAYFAWLADPEELRRRRVNVHVWAEALADERLAAVVAEGIAPARDAERALETAVATGATAGARRRHGAGPGDPGDGAGLRAAGGVGPVARHRPLRRHLHRSSRRLPRAEVSRGRHGARPAVVGLARR